MKMTTHKPIISGSPRFRKDQAPVMAIAGPDFLLEDCQMEIPYGYCQCGCGAMTQIALRTRNKRGMIKGQPVRYIKGHGRPNYELKKNRLYSIWIGMLQRCHYPKSVSYKNYGSRGITVCNEWRSRYGSLRFMNFMYSIGWYDGCELQMDRINNEKGYFPENIRLVTRSVNMLNSKRLPLNNRTGFRGVHYFKRQEKFRSYITINLKQIHLGYHPTARDAVIARDEFIIENKVEGAHTQVLKNRGNVCGY